MSIFGNIELLLNAPALIANENEDPLWITTLLLALIITKPIKMPDFAYLEAVIPPEIFYDIVKP